MWPKPPLTTDAIAPCGESRCSQCFAFLSPQSAGHVLGSTTIHIDRCHFIRMHFANSHQEITRFLYHSIFIWKVDNFALLWFLVMLSFVILQLNQLRKCSITPRLITLERSFPCMCIHVHFKMRLESKSALTKFTLKLFYFLVDLHMLFESWFGSKALSTGTTWKWFLFYVPYSHVLFQLAGLSKVALTYFTLVGFSFMNFHVLFQIPIMFFTQGTPSLWRWVG